MDIINELTDFQLNKLLFFRDASYSKNTKTSYWRMYLNYISYLEIEYNKDLYDFSQDEINSYKQKIKDKSKQTILQTNAFINKYMGWYVKFYDKPEKKFDLAFTKEKDNSWYISKKDFFKICDTILKRNDTISNITPLLFARYGIVGKESCYIRNMKWKDISFRNKEILIYNNDRSENISSIPIDDKFIEMILRIRSYEKEKYKGKKVKNRYIVKSQIKEEKIINYSSLNSKIYQCFKTTDRIAFTTLFNCAIVDYISKIYSKNVPRSNDELAQTLFRYYPEEILDFRKIGIIKKLYSEVTEDLLTLRTYGRSSKYKPLGNLTKQYIMQEPHILENTKVKRSKDLSRNEITINGNVAYILIKKVSDYEKVKINTEVIKKIKDYKWYFNIRGYVVARKKVGERLTVIHLANFILDKDEYYHIKFLNGDKLDCTLKNLEVGDLY